MVNLLPCFIIIIKNKYYILLYESSSGTNIYYFISLRKYCVFSQMSEERLD